MKKEGKVTDSKINAFKVEANQPNPHYAITSLKKAL